MLPYAIQKASWRPETFAAPQDQVDVYAQLPKSAYIKRKIKTRTRIIFTAGDRPVYDGEKDKHSPFARAFLDALDQGGSNKYGILSTGEIYSKLDALVSEPQRGSLSGSDGDFVFIASRSKVARVSTAAFQ
jgi:hypothetical protein